MSYHKYFFGGLKIRTGVLRKKKSKNFMKLIDRFTESLYSKMFKILSLTIVMGFIIEFEMIKVGRPEIL
jgi:hypothetical protein